MAMERSNATENAANDQAWWPWWRRTGAALLESRYCEVIVGSMVVFNTMMVIFDADSRAKDGESPSWVKLLEGPFTACFVIEYCVRLAVYRKEYFNDRRTLHYNLLDTVVVTSDALFKFISVFGDVNFSIAMFRVLRLARLFRFVRFLRFFQELQIMMSGFVAAMKAILWASAMLFVMLTLWSVVAVEVIHPVNLRVAESGYYEGCERCARAYASVMDSNLTFMQSVIAGDSWGLVSVPVVEESPVTILVFAGVIASINWAVLNLVLTVIVQIADKAKENDLEVMRNEKLRVMQEGQNRLRMLCMSLDNDDSGCLTFAELMDGFDSNQLFAETMSSLEVDKQDMEIVFRMLDGDGSGSVSYSEFIEKLYKMKTQDEKTTLMYISGHLNYVENSVTQVLREIHCDLVSRLVTGPGLDGQSPAEIAKVAGPETPTGDQRVNEAGVLQDASLMESLASVDITDGQFRAQTDQLLRELQAHTGRMLAEAEEHAKAQLESFGKVTDLLQQAGVEKIQSSDRRAASRDIDDPWSTAQWQQSSSFSDSLPRGRPPTVAVNTTVAVNIIQPSPTGR